MLSTGVASPGSRGIRASFQYSALKPVLSLRILHSFVASRFPPLFDPHYKLEADSKFCALEPLAINHTRQRLNAFLWSTNQQMLPRSAVRVSHDAGPPRAHILSDRALNKLRFVQV